MAQALFDDHPLQQYLRAAGEPPEMMPGSSPEFAQALETGLDDSEEPQPEWRPEPLVRIVAMLQSLFPQPLKSSMFAERFKYDVISSTLLASSLPAPHPRRRSPSPPLPGKLKLDADASPHPHYDSVDYRLLSVAFILAAIFLATGCYRLTTLIIGGAVTYVHNHTDDTKPDMTSTMEALHELVSANNSWDSIVQVTVNLLEKEEESPPSPVSSLRLAFHSSLHTTQTQCDNVRHLLSALTAPGELAQLSEMYAPPSPRHSLPPPSPDVASHESKRTTWNGSYTSLSGGPSMHVIKKREKRRSDLTLLFNTTSFKSHSAPSTPLVDVLEEEPKTPQPFGAAALALHRKRRLSGIDKLQGTSPRTPLTGSPSFSPASRFTTMHTMRHPLGLSALYHALDGALAAKRFACSHLLALRFGEEDDESYWEDVRSVIELLTTTFADATARLTEALEETDRQDAEFSNPEPVSLQDISADSSPGLDSSTLATGGRTASSMFPSFAPVPTHLTRFAAHVDAISSALDDAREHLADVVAVLRDKPGGTPQPHLRRRRSRTFSLSRLSESAAPPSEPAALQAYERLRRELGLALRECERGRDRLLDILAPPLPPPVDAAESEEDVPGLGHDASDECDESDQLDSTGPMEEEQHHHAVVVAPGDALDVDVAALDDSTARLLLGVSARDLALPGVEQVFESEAEVGVFARERSKLTREERIKIAKARRDSVPAQKEVVEREKWGPGGEVVQELKDVIWKVGERRRKRIEDNNPS